MYYSSNKGHLLEFQQLIYPKGACPGNGTLGHHRGVLHQTTSLDPLERLAGSTFSFGGVHRYIKRLSTAIKAFMEREYPDFGGKGLTIVPHVPSPHEGITWDDLTKHFVSERIGGLIQGQKKNLKIYTMLIFLR